MTITTYTYRYTSEVVLEVHVNTKQVAYHYNIRKLIITVKYMHIFLYFIIYA